MSAFGVGEALAAVVDLGQRVGCAHPPGRLNLFARLQFLVDLEEVLDLQEVNSILSSRIRPVL
jgi:hypothetical protein